MLRRRLPNISNTPNIPNNDNNIIPTLSKNNSSRGKENPSRYGNIFPNQSRGNDIPGAQQGSGYPTKSLLQLRSKYTKPGPFNSQIEDNRDRNKEFVTPTIPSTETNNQVVDQRGDTFSTQPVGLNNGVNDTVTSRTGDNASEASQQRHGQEKIKAHGDNIEGADSTDGRQFVVRSNINDIGEKSDKFGGKGESITERAPVSDKKKDLIPNFGISGSSGTSSTSGSSYSDPKQNFVSFDRLPPIGLGGGKVSKFRGYGDDVKRIEVPRRKYSRVEDQEVEDQEVEDQEVEDQEVEDQEVEDQEVKDQGGEDQYPEKIGEKAIQPAASAAKSVAKSVAKSAVKSAVKSAAKSAAGALSKLIVFLFTNPKGWLILGIILLIIIIIIIIVLAVQANQTGATIGMLHSEYSEIKVYSINIGRPVGNNYSNVFVSSSAFALSGPNGEIIKGINDISIQIQTNKKMEELMFAFNIPGVKFKIINARNSSNIQIEHSGNTIIFTCSTSLLCDSSRLLVVEFSIEFDTPYDLYTSGPLEIRTFVLSLTSAASDNLPIIKFCVGLIGMSKAGMVPCNQGQIESSNTSTSEGLSNLNSNNNNNVSFRCPFNEEDRQKIVCKSGFYDKRSVMADGLHGGIDLAPLQGNSESVYSTVNGVINYILDPRLYNRRGGVTIVVLDESTNTEYLYAHLSSEVYGRFKVGDKVTVGQFIGKLYAGPPVPGWWSQKHLHFEIRKPPGSKNKINPLDDFKKSCNLDINFSCAVGN